jgi:preprotein translocase subunit SecB
MAEEQNTQESSSQQQTAEEPRFVIQRIYIKDVSFESPNSPAVYAEEWQPETNLQMNTQATPLGNNYYEVELELTITVKSNDKTAFLVEVTQAGVFEIVGYTQEQLNQLLASYAPGTLFPYAREAIASLVSKGSFPEMHLSPINFDALYAQRLEEAAQQNAGGNAPNTANTAEA